MRRIVQLAAGRVILEKIFSSVVFPVPLRLRLKVALGESVGVDDRRGHCALDLPVFTLSCCNNVNYNESRR